MADDHQSARIAMEAQGDGGVVVIDPVERRRYRIGTPEPVDPEPVPTDAFRFPVDAAATIETARIELPDVEMTFVRDGAGDLVAEFQQFAEASFGDGPYEIELSPPIKLYLRVEGSFRLRSDGESMRFAFGEPTAVAVGARSYHERPAATVTTTADPADLRAAISSFGSALKTTSPERSFPTLRGHPPEVELGDELDVPACLEPPAEDVRVEVPPDHEHLFPVAPLAYYLGAPVEAGPVPRIVGDGLLHDLDGGTVGGAELTFECAVERTLQQVFLLDCVTRTEGLYPVDLHERRALEDAVDLDFAALYDAPQAERLDAYLSVPFETVAEHVPDWGMAASVAPEAESVETLPYLVDDLSLVRTGSSTPVDPEAVQDGSLHGMVRGAAESEAAQYVRSDVGDAALEETWVGEGMPVDASKAVTEAYRNRIGRTPDDGDIEIAVVCNDAAMDSERDAVDEVYGSRDDLAFDVTVFRDLPTEDLRDVLDSRYDLLHYIGHIEDDGVRCEDGHLDVAELEAVGLDAFVLNACRSYDQGLKLVERGAIGGIVTLSEVVNMGAVRIGKDVARLLNCGFPLHAALDVARDASVVGVEYNVIGDGSLTVAQTENGVPLLHDVEKHGSDYHLTYQTFAPGNLGGFHYPLLKSNDQHYLVSGDSGSFQLSSEAFKEFLAEIQDPVRFNGSLYSAEKLLEQLD